MLRFSVIIPSLDRAQLLAETLASVSRQCYSEIEQIVIDRGSSDHSVEILQNWRQPQFAWMSEPGINVAEALNRAVDRSTGDVLTYLNCGDLYMPDVILEVARYFHRNPHSAIVYGRCGLRNGGLTDLRELPTGAWNLDRQLMWGGCRQPAVFWRRQLATDLGGFDERLCFAHDLEYWLRLGQVVAPCYLQERILVAAYRNEDWEPEDAMAAHEEILDIVCHYAVESMPAYAALQAVARMRAEHTVEALDPNDRSPSSLQKCYSAWLLVYAERYQIAVPESFLVPSDLNPFVASI